MKYTYLGRTGMKVSRLCLGTMNFGVDTEEKEAFKIMDAALDAGINFLDTANVYGWGTNSGASERIIGNWFSQGGGRRERTVLATKVHEIMSDPNDGPNDCKGLSTYKVRRHLEASLKRLQTDHLELYYMHHIDRNVTWDEMWDVFESLFTQGKIDYVGSSNFAGWHLAVAQAEAKKRHFMGIVSEQHKYNLNCRLPELEVLPSAKSHGIGVIPWSPLDGGLLGSNALKTDKGARSLKSRARIEKHYNQLVEFEKLCKELGERQDNVALAWILANPAVTAPVIGPRTLEQFNESLRAVEIELSEEVMKKLDEIFPGPGKPAPEAYGW